MSSAAPSTATTPERSPWPALWALVIGFFMILVDTTIVSVANPAIKRALDPNTNNLDNVIWLTSAYLLTYAVPLLVTGRLGDRFGPKNIYLIGLVIFTASSFWCGLSDSLGTLVAARAVQGLGAALMTPQTMAVITRTFPPQNRGAAMGLWGATAGVATLVGPLLGGVLVDGLGWEWIFFINVPIGVIAFIAAWVLVPKLPTHPHSFDIPGVLISGAGLFFLVFGLQEAEHYDWGKIWGPITIWELIGLGVALLVVFVLMQWKTKKEPLVPLSLFRDRNFSVANLGITTVGFAITSMTLPMMFYAQVARGLTPTQTALLMVPMAVISAALAPFAGRLLDRVDPRLLLVPGLTIVTASLLWYASLMRADTPIWMLLLPSALMGIGQAGMWGPLATTANRNLPPRLAGAGSGVYNTTRTVGSVIGSASIAALIQARMQANLPGMSSSASAFSEGAGTMPTPVVERFSDAMAQSMLLPAMVLFVGALAMFFMQRPSTLARVPDRSERV